MIPTSVVTGQGIPNPDHIYAVTIGMPETVDPHWAYDTASGTLIQNVYEPLCIFNVTDANSFLPAIADDWPGLGTAPGNAIIPSPPDPAAPEGTVETWYFRIRPNVPWHDSSYGNVTSDDVEYSFERGMLMDHSAGPMWMLYEPLLLCDTSYEYDLNGNGTLEKTEYIALALDIDGAIQSNATHVWFNLKQPYAPFQQILSQTWSEVMCRKWCEEQGLWNKTLVETYGWASDEAYAEFLRTWDPPEPGPLMEPKARAMGTGPYTLEAYDPDPHTGYYTLKKFDGYWRGWPAPGEFFTDGSGAGGFATYATVKSVEEWSNRKAQFFSTDPALQADFCAVPRMNCPELHVNKDKDGPTLPGFRLMKIVVPILDAFYFTFTVNPNTPYPPKLGTEVKLDLFSDRYLRLGFIYCFNFTKYIQDVYLGEAIHPGVCMPPGTAYYNESKPVYDINLTKAVEYFNKAWNGRVKSEGITVTLVYNIGNVLRQTAAEMLEYYIENYVDPLVDGKLDIIVKGEPWSTYLPGMRTRMYAFFTVGWLADFPDPHNWFQPFMHPLGTYCGRQNVTYGLDPTSLAENWYEGASYGPPPYTNALGEYVPEINNTYVAHLIDVGVGLSPELREKVYNELMDIYYAEATQLPLGVTVGRHYERTWINGYDKTFNMNPISPGLFFYTIWKAAVGTVYEADISALDTIVNTTTVYPLIQVYLGEMRLGGNPAKINYSLSVKYLSGTGAVLIYVGLKRDNKLLYPTYPNETYIPWDLPPPEVVLTPGGTWGPEEVVWYEDGTMWVGVWNISLTTSPVAGSTGELVSDPDTTNNQQFTPHLVEAKELVGDIDGTGEVDIFDAITFAGSFGAIEGAPNWNALCDLNGDKIIDIFDAILLAGNFGASIP
ncbi:MAG: hypothetical protein KIH10_14815 [Candidatus Freyarchaeota archaeon]|nr:hypothetical protein [Candidatus Jordarchaeia archaeon]